MVALQVDVVFRLKSPLSLFAHQQPKPSMLLASDKSIFKHKVSKKRQSQSVNSNRIIRGS